MSNRPTGHRRPLLARPEERLARVNAHLDPDVGRGQLVSHDLEELTTNIAFRPLVGCAKDVGPGATPDKRTRQHDQQCGSHNDSWF